MVDLDVGGQTVTFMVDTGAEHSVVTMPVAPLGDRRVTIMGASGDQAKSRQFCQARTCKLGGHTVSHEFLYLPDCPIPLLGRELLTKLGVQISFEPSVQATMSLQPPSEGLILSITTLRKEWRLYGTGSVEQNPEAYRANFPELKTVRALNPATFLPTEEGDPEHDCIEVINEVYATRPDLRDSPHPNLDLTLYTDGSSFLTDRKRHAGYAVTTTDEVLEAGALPLEWSSQRAELWALIRALTLSEGRKVNIYTNSQYTHGAIYKERSHLPRRKKTIKNKQKVLKLLQAIWLPQQVAVIHCRGHQRGNEPSAVGDRLADTTAKLAAMRSLSELLLVTDTTTTSLPRKTALEGLLAKNFYISRLSGLCKSIGEHCLTCAKSNPKSSPSPIAGIQRSGTTPFEDLEVNFTDMTNCRGTKYMLVLVCTYSGWVEAFPTWTEKSREVAKVLLREIIPCYGLPLSIHSDNGPAFIAELLQTVTRATGINWRLHAAYRPQSSGKVECMNRTLKETLAKLHQETSLGWVDLLPLAVLRARCTPGKSGLSPFEIMFRRPLPC
ncbi:hypothetical protein mRhiFer1_008737 [Rhinolophus ferrumequinum]|uniref:Uncharacterized protein n=1 Tax=Rhinolophus ferrumequinum TaxID=59479 RepID=A0A7J7TM62_RHIFE|nr:hypothetical protein mRhiFer1_008737 [Rhinolophus ferrumequinum]